jgi:hypothetical protein
VKDAERYEHAVAEGLGEHLGQDFAVVLRHACDQHADAALCVTRQLAGAGVSSSGPGPAGADLPWPRRHSLTISSVRVRQS